MKKLMQWAIAFTVIAAPACAQSPSFEVATIKPGVPDSPGKIIRPNHRNFSTLNTTLVDLITYAYGLHPSQITGGPGWIKTDKYDLAGIPDQTGTPSPAEVKVMVQGLLAERFGLQFHRERKELNVFDLTVAKTGSKLTPSEGSDNTSLLLRALGKLVAKNATMADFAGVMQANALDRPVLDRTNLIGKFDFTLEWLPDETHPDENDSRPTLSAAFQQLGLKIEAVRALVDVFVIDHVGRPSDN
jgi:uncharacterized protein (TIGR03435 family)